MSWQTVADYLTFRRMVTPVAVQVVFWVLVVFAVGMGLVGVGLGFFAAVLGNLVAAVVILLLSLAWMVVSLASVRIYCELIVVIFRVNETLTDILRYEMRMKTY